MSANGVNEDGYRKVIGRSEGFAERKDCWHGFLSWLKSRGLRGVRMLTGDKAYRKAEISRNTAYSHLAKNNLSCPEHPSVPRSCVRARSINARDLAIAMLATSTDRDRNTR